MMPSQIVADTNNNHDSNKPLWMPSTTDITSSNLNNFMTALNKHFGVSLADYNGLYQWSVDHVEDFWSFCWDYFAIKGNKGNAPYLINANKMPGAQFFPNATINYAENLLNKTGATTALIFRSEGDFVERTLSWDELRHQVSQFAQSLRAEGVTKGDRVCGLMPNMPETIIAMLATASIGAIWSSASPDFGVQGVLDRFGQIEPKIMITVEGYYYNGKVIDCLGKIAEIMPQIPSLKKTVIVSYTRETFDLPKNSVSYNDFTSKFDGAKDITFEAVAFNHPLFIMFSSGTTGIPKCIVHGHGGTLIQHIKEHHLHCNLSEGDVAFYFTTCGWMMWNWLVSGLAVGATLALYDGSPFYPDGNVLFNYADAYQFKLFGTSAKYIDALKKQGYEPMKTHKLTSVKTLTSTGSPLVAESFDYVYGSIKKDIHLASISGGTDIVSCFVLGNPISPVYRGEIQCAGLGMAVTIFDDNGRPMTEGKGELVCTKPFPSMPVAFWNDEDGARYKAAYFENYDNIWCHGDWIEKTPQGGLIIHGRSDATLNPGGVRIGTAEIYRQVEKLPEVIESIAIGQEWDDDVRVVLFVTLRDGITLDDTLTQKIKQTIKVGATPRHVPAKIVQVTDIPRTKSGKITEIAVRDVVHGRVVKNTQALANPEALEQYKNRKELVD